MMKVNNQKNLRMINNTKNIRKGLVVMNPVKNQAQEKGLDHVIKNLSIEEVEIEEAAVEAEKIKKVVIAESEKKWVEIEKIEKEVARIQKVEIREVKKNQNHLKSKPIIKFRNKSFRFDSPPRELNPENNILASLGGGIPLLNPMLGRIFILWI